ncbi:unnamed protein product [Trichogramma brassicae]|uniref:C2H2-type domain-containing protein n=1 Tax=Trichogramma brassicae TaxID=86971 RepID=A0A6H5HYT6_9HYME|nr:unnamed protein product [Trichogramma brassicae]
MTAATPNYLWKFVGPCRVCTTTRPRPWPSTFASCAAAASRARARSASINATAVKIDSNNSSSNIDSSSNNSKLDFPVSYVKKFISVARASVGIDGPIVRALDWPYAASATESFPITTSSVAIDESEKMSLTRRSRQMPTTTTTTTTTAAAAAAAAAAAIVNNSIMDSPCYSCTKCGNAYGRLHSLNRHLRLLRLSSAASPAAGFRDTGRGALPVSALQHHLLAQKQSAQSSQVPVRPEAALQLPLLRLQNQALAQREDPRATTAPQQEGLRGRCFAGFRHVTSLSVDECAEENRPKARPGQAAVPLSQLPEQFYVRARPAATRQVRLPANAALQVPLLLVHIQVAVQHVQSRAPQSQGPGRLLPRRDERRGRRHDHSRGRSGGTSTLRFRWQSSLPIAMRTSSKFRTTMMLYFLTCMKIFDLIKTSKNFSNTVQLPENIYIILSSSVLYAIVVINKIKLCHNSPTPPEQQPPALQDDDDDLSMFGTYSLIEPFIKIETSHDQDGSSSDGQLIIEGDPIAVILDPTHPNVCGKCGKAYKHNSHLVQHEKYECQQPPRFGCMYCPYRSKRKTDIRRHIRIKHQDKDCEYDMQAV